jgi:four helix bundle protein
MGYRSFEELEVWKRGCQLAVKVYQATDKCSDLPLRNQMRRAAVSIASNIAEGAERGGKDFARFLRVACGSAAELRTQAYIASRVGHLSTKHMTDLVSDLKEISKMLTGLSKSLRKRPRLPHTEN